MIKEQRQTVRHDSQRPVYYTFPGNNQRYTGRCINISNNGILLESDQLLEVDSAILVCLTSENEDTPPLNILVEVNWQSKQSKQSKQLYHAGATIKAVLATHATNNV
jgi:hypothetical protein